MDLMCSLDRPGTVFVTGGFMGTPALFANPREVISCGRSDALRECLREVELARKQGYYCAGFLSYEAGEQLMGFSPRRDVDFPGLWFGVYEAPEIISDVPPGSGDEFEVKLTPELQFGDYRTGFNSVQEYLRRGQTYQTNYSFRLEGRTSVNPVELFITSLNHHPVPYAAYVNTGKFSVGSLSPELFLKKRGDQLEARPMKGTAARGQFPGEDCQRRRWLEKSVKNRAENVMIVDLFRNDLGRLAPAGEVEVPELFHVAKYPTVHQMVSTVRATSGADFQEVMRNTFPSGSVTGAPKRRTMEIIREIEQSPRKIYTGGIGVLEPNGDFTINVAIRSFLCREQTGEIELGVGGGVVVDSEVDSEWEEARLKGRFLNYRRDDFRLIETMRCQPGEGVDLLELHLGRLRRSAEFFSIPVEVAEVRSRLAKYWETAEKNQVLRLLVDRDGDFTISRKEMPSTPEKVHVRLATDRVDATNRFRRHKTSRRELYDRYRERAEQSEVFDYIFLNEADELVEATVANLFLEVDGQLVTPPLESGALPGVMRRQLLRTGQAEVREVGLEELRRSESIYLTNAVRGRVEVDSVRGLETAVNETFS